MNFFERVKMFNPERLDEVSFPLAHKYLEANFPHIKTKDIPMILNHYLRDSGLRVLTDNEDPQKVLAELEDFLIKQTEAYKARTTKSLKDGWFTELLKAKGI